MTPWSVTLRFPGETWYLIHDFDQLLKMWQKAMSRRRFFEVRYAGRRYFVNPAAIICIEGQSQKRGHVI